MTKAEKASIAYQLVAHGPRVMGGDAVLSDDDFKFWNINYDFVAGYEQAWKDIKEWVEEQVTILDKQTLLHPDDDVFWGQRNAYKQMKDKLNSL